MEKKSMGSFLTALRKASGLTQKQLAEKLNVPTKRSAVGSGMSAHRIFP